MTTRTIQIPADRPDLRAAIGADAFEIREDDAGLRDIYVDDIRRGDLSGPHEEALYGLARRGDNLLVMTDTDARNRKQRPVLGYRRKAVHYGRRRV